MQKVKAVMTYYDKELGFEKKKGETYEVEDFRAQILVNAGVAKIIKQRQNKGNTASEKVE